MWEAIIFAVIALGGMVASRILSARRKPKQQEIESLEVPSASEGRPIPVVFGTVDLKNSNVVWWGDTKQVAVKQDGQTVNYKYYVGLHLALHMGHADRLVNLQIDEKLVFSNVSGAFDNLFDRLTAGDRSLSYEELFGGQFKDGGFSGILDFDTGEPDQTYNDYLNGAMNTNPNEAALIKVPAYRGITGLIARQCYIGTSSYMRPWIVRTQRILKRFDGIEQWYVEKAIIKTAQNDIIVNPTDEFEYKIIDPSIEVPFFDDFYAPGWTPARFNYFMTEYSSKASYLDFYMIPFMVNWTTSQGSYVFDGIDDGAFGHNYTGEFDINVDWTLKRALWVKKSFDSTGKYNFRVTGYIDSNINAKCWVCLDDTKIVLNGSVGNQYEFVIDSADIPAGTHVLRILALSDYTDEFDPDVSDTNYFTIQIEKDSSNSMNPAHIVREILTDPDWGMNHLESDIDDESFIIAADKLYAENFGLCIEWDRQSSAESFMNEVLQHINGQVYNDRSTGKFVLKLIRDDYVKSLLSNITESKIKSLSGFKKQMLPELVNEVVLTYWDLDLGLESTISIQDGALVQKQDGVNSKSISYRGIVSSEVANKVCRRDLNVLSSPLISFSILVTNQISDFSIGDVFNVTFPDYSIDDMTVRVSGITYGDGVKNDVVIQVVQDIFSLPDDGFYIQGEVGWEAPSTVIPGIFASLAMEIPYFKLAALQGQAAIDSALSTLPTIGYIAAVAGRPASNAINADVYRDTGSGYTYNNTIDFCPYCLLGENIDRTQTSFTVVAEVETESLSVGTILQIDDELMSVVSLVSGTLTVKRGVYDSIVAEHLAESYVMFWSEFVENLFTQYNDGDSVDSKILTRTGEGVLDLADVDELTVDLASRAIKPYPPGNLKINGTYFPEYILGTLTLTWSHRNRTNFSPVDFQNSTETSDSGVTYNLRVYDQSDSLISDITSIDADNYTYDNEYYVPDSESVNTNVLIDFEGETGTSVFTDLKGNFNLSKIGDPVISETEFKIKFKSCHFDGNDIITCDGIIIPATNDWCFECFVYPTDLSVTRVILAQRPSTGIPDGRMQIEINNQKFKLFIGGSGGVDISDSSNLSLNIWSHIAVSRDGTTFRGFVNGIKVFETTSSISIYQQNTYLGGVQTSSVGFVGYIDYIRGTSGVSRYTTDFTPPSITGTLNSMLRIELESEKNSLVSYNKYNETIYRAGWGLSWGRFWV